MTTEGVQARCEVAKLLFCSEDVKTATLSPCEVATCVGGCVYDNGQGCNFKTVRNIGLNFRKQPQKHRQNTLLFLKRRASFAQGFGGQGGLGGRQYTEADVSAFFS